MITGHFLDADLPVVDGVVRVARAYRAAMEKNLGPSWLVAPGGAEARKICIPSVRLREPYRLGVPALAPRLGRRIDRVGFDVVHAHSPFAAGRLARAAARRGGIPLVFTLHSRYPEWGLAQYRRDPRYLGLLAMDAALRAPRFHRPRLRDLLAATEAGRRFCVEATQRLVWDFCLGADRVLVATETFRRELLGYAESGPPRERGARTPDIHVVRHGIDFPERAPGRTRVRERHGVPPGAALLLYVGQLADEKELPFLLDALGELARAKADFRLLLIGEGPDRAAYEARARALGISRLCVFAGPIRERERLADYYAQADLFVFPSLYETQGLVAMEAASFGLPLVGQAGAPGLSEVFVDGQSACFARREPGAYARAVAALLADPARARALGEEARRAVRRTEQAVGEVGRIYGELIERAPRPKRSGLRAPGPP